MRHVRELGNILQASYSSNCERLDKPVLLLYTDGGGDHNVGCSKDMSHSELG